MRSCSYKWGKGDRIIQKEAFGHVSDQQNQSWVWAQEKVE